MTRQNGVTEPVAQELGPVGHELVMRLLSRREREPAHALAGMLASAYGALVGGDPAAARALLGEVLAPALELERALKALQQAQGEAQASADTLAGVAPVATDPGVAFNAAQLVEWREALEVTVAAQMDVIERLKVVEQLAGAALEPASA
jgi:hypothetical protein